MEINQRDILTALATALRPALYIEYGVHMGETIMAVAPLCGRAIGVEKNPELPFMGGYEDHRMDTREFSGRILPGLPPVDLSFIDADHDSGPAFEDFYALYRHTAPGGLVLLHDTYPADLSQTDHGFCSDSWRVPRIIAAVFPDAEQITLPVPPGITIVRKASPGTVKWMLGPNM